MNQPFVVEYKGMAFDCATMLRFPVRVTGLA